ncbi:MAG: class I tRNA ligase family protein, partial [Anaerolineales bacterium]
GRDALTRYDPDALRYYLTVNMPEMKDSDWDWADFLARNNNELVATWGNLANRVLSFAYKHWEGHVPDVPDEFHQGTTFRPIDLSLLTTVDSGFESVGRELEAVRLRSALGEAMKLATAVNQYLDQTSPWSEIKKDKSEAAKTIYTALRAIDSLKVLFAPFLPFTSEKLHQYLGYDTPLFGEQYIEEVEDSLGTHNVLRYRDVSRTDSPTYWKRSKLEPNQKLREPGPLFKKLEESVIEEERARLGR